MHPVIIIPARRASTRLPSKPLADIAGKPMITHVYERAIASNVGDVWVATDDQEIANTITNSGGKAIMTDTNHTCGSDRIWEALRQIDPKKQHDVVINLQGDLPTIDPDLIQKTLHPLKNPSVDIATLVCAIDNPQDEENPAIVKPVITWQKNGLCGQALYFSRHAIPYGETTKYHHIGIYAYRRTALEQFVALPPSPLEKSEKLEQLRALEYGMRMDVIKVETVPLGVDTQEQLEQARNLLS